MKYSYECKQMCVEMYREGKWPETPEGIQERNFHGIIRRWVRIEEASGPETLRNKNRKRVWTAEEEYELVAQILSGALISGTAYSAGIEHGFLHHWVERYKMKGYEGLVGHRMGRPRKEPQDMKQTIVLPELTPSERGEMIRLKAKIEYLEAENAVIKKRYVEAPDKSGGKRRRRYISSTTLWALPVDELMKAEQA